MGLLLLLPLLLNAGLDDDEAFNSAKALYLAGDPVAAEIALGPLLEQPHVAKDKAQLLLWAAMCADASGRASIAERRVQEAVFLDREIQVPEQASLRLAKLLQRARRLPPIGLKTTIAVADVQAKPGGPSVDKASDDGPSNDVLSSDKASNDVLSSDKAANDKAATDKAATDKAATDKAATDKAARSKRSDQKPPAKEAGEVPEEPAAFTVSTSLWAVAGGTLTVAMLLSTGAAVFGIYGALLYYESLSADAADAAALAKTAEDGFRFTAILGGLSLVAYALSAATAGGAWWLEQE